MFPFVCCCCFSRLAVRSCADLPVEIRQLCRTQFIYSIYRVHSRADQPTARKFRQTHSCAKSAHIFYSMAYWCQHKSQCMLKYSRVFVFLCRTTALQCNPILITNTNIERTQTAIVLAYLFAVSLCVRIRTWDSIWRKSYSVCV